MRIDPQIRLNFEDVLIRPKRSTLCTRKDVDLKRKFIFRNSQRRWHGVPIVASNMDTIGTFSMASVLQRFDMVTCVHKHYNHKAWQDRLENKENAISLDHLAMTFGIDDIEVITKLLAVSKNPPSFLCLDVANGYSEAFLDKVKEVSGLLDSKYQSDQKPILIAGNVVTGEMTEALLIVGADIVKLGIGPGSVCTTRAVSGVGYPQLSAIIECADAAHGLGGHVMADGGCRKPGDVAKAFGAGADFVMLGGMLAGHDECEGEFVEEQGTKFMKFYGMSSVAAMEKYSGGVANYRAAEGRVVKVPYKGKVENTLQEILGGVRSACTYVGASTLKAFPRCTTFIQTMQQHTTMQTFV